MQTNRSTRPSLGVAYLGDSMTVMSELGEASVSLIVTSPPFPLTFQKKKPYESVPMNQYVGWFLAYAEHFKRVLKDDGSLVIDIGGIWNKGLPTRSLYQYRLVVALCDH